MNIILLRLLHFYIISNILLCLFIIYYGDNDANEKKTESFLSKKKNALLICIGRNDLIFGKTINSEYPRMLILSSFISNSIKSNKSCSAMTKINRTTEIATSGR